ncbi:MULTISPECIES: hypothetical protein [unclassified Mameliella]|uniref:hypothetical protein n=1 Tax=unclassified Mameliella TaxID=2630630 RepID=UPI00273D2DE6|nr:MULTISPECIES: hypothetical protein [unclassified Mameliella]
MTVKATVTARMDIVQRGGNDFGTDKFSPVVEAVLNTANGTGANQADIVFVDEREVPESSNDDLDLAGALSDAFGATVAAAEVVAILIINAPRTGTANASDLTIGGATNAFEGFLGGTSPTIGPIKPGGFVMIGAGDVAGIGTVTGGSADELRIANGSGGAATYQIAILARSA